MKKIIIISLTLLISSCVDDNLNQITKTDSTSSFNKKQINVVPLDGVSKKDVDFAITELKQFYNCEVVLLNKDSIPEKFKVKGTKKYDAADVILNLKNKYAKNNGKILGLTSKEISIDERKINGKVYKNWSILGLGFLGGKSCVVSTNRMNGNNKRLSKVVIHEIGHNLNLNHCDKTPHCLMNDAKGTAKTIDKEKKIMCEFCTKNIKW